MDAFKMLNKLGSRAWMPQAGGNPLHHAISPEFPGQGGHRSLAVVLALPAVGMLAGGFALDRPLVGWAGVGIFVAMAIFYTVVAWQILSRLD
jgi:hypothetical protein